MYGVVNQLYIKNLVIKSRFDRTGPLDELCLANLFQVMTFLRVILNYPRRGCRTLSKKNGLIFSELLETVDKHDSTISKVFL